MSVDLVGSTAFKASKKHSELQNGNPSPEWVDEFRTFYKDFPIEVKGAYDILIKGVGEDLSSDADNRPRVWKTIGDEIIFCGRVYSVEHAATSVSAFLKALEHYSKRLEADDKPLRLKGAGWLAAFPAPNISIAITSDPLAGHTDVVSMPSENTEEFERAADDAPSRFDFLGKGIDTGFRIAKNASEDRFVTSVQLGYILALAATKKKFPHSFGYHGRETLKGVIDGAPYPVVSVDTERSDLKSKLKSREAALTGEGTIQPHALCDFLETFMTVCSIEMPCLGEMQTGWNSDFPETYRRYQNAFEANLAIDNANVRQVVDAIDLPDSNDDVFEESKNFLDAFATADGENQGEMPSENSEEK